jgi:hypothetical protein
MFSLLAGQLSCNNTFRPTHVSRLSSVYNSKDLLIVGNDALLQDSGSGLPSFRGCIVEYCLLVMIRDIMVYTDIGSHVVTAILDLEMLKARNTQSVSGARNRRTFLPSYIFHMITGSYLIGTWKEALTYSGEATLQAHFMIRLTNGNKQM